MLVLKAKVKWLQYKFNLNKFKPREIFSVNFYEGVLSHYFINLFSWTQISRSPLWLESFVRSRVCKDDTASFHSWIVTDRWMNLKKNTLGSGLMWQNWIPTRRIFALCHNHEYHANRQIKYTLKKALCWLVSCDVALLSTAHTLMSLLSQLKESVPALSCSKSRLVDYRSNLLLPSQSVHC